MDAEKEALKIVNNTLSSIESAMRDWKVADKKTKNKFTERIERLKKWQTTLEQWKKEFLEAKSDQKYKLLVQLHEIGRIT